MMPPIMGAYYRSEDAIEAYQKKYPQLQVLLDIHRDAIQTNDTTRIKPVATINGKKCRADHDYIRL